LVLKNGETRSDALFRLLRQVARSSRAAQDQTFYLLREVAGHFDLPLSMVSRVLSRLESEGLLGGIRGSRTVLPGRKFDHHLFIRGVVGIPVSIFRFSAFAEYREFVLVLRRKLRRHHFMPAAVFYEQAQDRVDFLSERLFDARADHVLWFSPRRVAAEILPILRDAGMQVNALGDSAENAIPCQYQIDREDALRTMLRAWRAAGVSATVVLSGGRGASAADEERYRSLSAEEFLPSKIVRLEETSAAGAIRRMSRRQGCGVLLTRAAASFLALRQPGSLAALTKERRVGLIEGPVTVWFGTISGGPVDLISLDWERIANEIIADLISRSGREGVVFKAATQLQVPLARCCRKL
jgi:hypothetical protein